MQAIASILILFPGMSFRRQAVRALAAALGPDPAGRVWDGTLRAQAVLAKERPRYSPGTNLLLRYMEWDCALFRAARDQGVSAEAAMALVENINWSIFASMTELSFRLSRLRSSRPLTRVRWIVDLLFRVVFTSPFRRNSVPGTDQVAFDVVACPLATYFRDRGLPELTASAACSLDHRMADVWGVTLQRGRTIAQGDPLCDFRFRVKVVGPAALASQDPGTAAR